MAEEIWSAVFAIATSLIQAATASAMPTRQYLVTLKQIVGLTTHQTSSVTTVEHVFAEFVSATLVPTLLR